MRRRPCAFAAAVCLALVGCGGPATTQTSTAADEERTCLVVSSGATAGVAHAGALDALRDAGVEVDCLVASSAGALFGSLYASDPNGSVEDKTRALFGRYVRATRAEARDRGILFGLLVLATGGGALLAAGAGVGAAMTTNQRELSRTIDVLRRQLGAVQIEDLYLDFVALHARVEGEGLETVAVSSGDLAEAVEHSIANPFVFEDVRIPGRHRFDGAADTLVAVPVDHACRMFPGADLIVLNASGRPVAFTQEMDCDFMEIVIEAPADVNRTQVVKLGPDFDRLIAAGRTAVERALEVGQ